MPSSVGVRTTLPPRASISFTFSIAYFSGTTRITRVAALGADQGQADPGIARGRLDQGAAFLQQTLLLGPYNHAQSGTILDAPPGVNHSSLAKIAARSIRRETPQLDHRRVAHQLEHGTGGRGPPEPRGPSTCPCPKLYQPRAARPRRSRGEEGGPFRRRRDRAAGAPAAARAGRFWSPAGASTCPITTSGSWCRGSSPGAKATSPGARVWQLHNEHRLPARS